MSWVSSPWSVSNAALNAQAVYARYQTMGVPESLLIDRQGRIVERYVGPREWDAAEYVDRIERLVSASAVGERAG